ncbi:MAG: carboxylating nicotinate-nucleotide diphosphorylase [Candidatus Binatales bacterium]
MPDTVNPTPLNHLALDDLIARALAEDLGHGDITTAATVMPEQRGRAVITAKESRAVFCGGILIERVFSLSGAEPRVESLAAEGEKLTRGAKVAEIEGRLCGLLIGERTALNFIQLMSGIATATQEYVRAIKGTRAKIVDTRKTHPGLRAIEKYAVRVGGGFNHRFGLDSGVLIKENHIAAAGSVWTALERARAAAPHTLKIEIECENLAQVKEAFEAGADVILLDNMPIGRIRNARKLVGERVMLEVSGSVTLKNVRAIAETGVDLISIGALTRSARAIDLSMRIEPA